MNPSKKAIEAAYSVLPFNDLLYGDTSKACSKEEVAKMLEAAYAAQFNGIGMEIREGQIIHYDEFGEDYVLDEAGNHIPPLQSMKSEEHSGWTEYDSSRGHCGLCGSLTCHGGCFR